MPDNPIVYVQMFIAALAFLYALAKAPHLVLIILVFFAVMVAWQYAIFLGILPWVLLAIAALGLLVVLFAFGGTAALDAARRALFGGDDEKSG